jgi:hypothetical protein
MFTQKSVYTTSDGTIHLSKILAAKHEIDYLNETFGIVCKQEGITVSGSKKVLPWKQLKDLRAIQKMSEKDPRAIEVGAVVRVLANSKELAPKSFARNWKPSQADKFEGREGTVEEYMARTRIALVCFDDDHGYDTVNVHANMLEVVTPSDFVDSDEDYEEDEDDEEEYDDY